MNSFIQVVQTFPLKHIRRWAAGTNSFTIDVGQYKNEYVTVQTTKEDAEEMSKLISGYVDLLLKRQREGRVQCETDDAELAKVEELDPVIPVVQVAERRRSKIMDKLGDGFEYKAVQQSSKRDDVSSSMAVQSPKKEQDDDVSSLNFEESSMSPKKEQEDDVSSLNFEEPSSARPSPPKKQNANNKQDSKPKDEYAALVCLQEFDGKWSISDALCAIAGINLLPSPCGLDERIWASAIAIAILNLRFRQFQVEWELLVVKSGVTQQQVDLAIKMLKK